MLLEQSLLAANLAVNRFVFERDQFCDLFPLYFTMMRLSDTRLALKISLNWCAYW